MATGAAELGAAKARIDMQKDFVSKLRDSIDRGVGQLVDADMNKESTRLQALQVQQQLGIQALSIANGNSQSILSLFRGRSLDFTTDKIRSGRANSAARFLFVAVDFLFKWRPILLLASARIGLF